MARHLLKGVNPTTFVIGFLAAIGCTAVANHANSYGIYPNGAGAPNSISVAGDKLRIEGIITARQRSADVTVLVQNLPPGIPGFPFQLPMNQPPRQWTQQQQPQWGQPQPQPRPRQQSAQGAQAEQAFRNALVMQGISGGFGGIFGPGLKKWMNTPSAPSSGGDKCGGYSEYAAKQACGAGDGWAADRLQNHQSGGAERDWYNR